MAKRRMVKFQLDEISPVDVPAQGPALLAIMKRREDNPYDDEEVRKRAALTTANDGHTHLVQLDFDSVEMNSGYTSWDGDPGHSHPWVQESDGRYVIGRADGHSHKLATVSKNTPEGADKPADPEGDDQVGKNQPKSTMTPEEIKAQKDAHDAMTKRAESAEKLLELNDGQRAYHKNLEGDASETFLTLSDDARQKLVDAEVAKTNEENAVVYTADDGTEFRKNDDPRLVTMAKKSDKQDAEIKKSRGETEQASFEKRASEDLSHTTGEQVEKVALLKAVAGITDADLRGKVETILRAADGAFKKLQEATGTSIAPTGDDADPADQLEALAKRIETDEKIPYLDAYDKAVNSDEGKRLYAENAEQGRARAMQG